MGVRRYDSSYLKKCGIDPHTYKRDWDVGSDFDITIDSNSGEIVLINNKTNNLIYTGDNIDNYINDEGEENEY